MADEAFLEMTALAVTGVSFVPTRPQHPAVSWNPLIIP